MSVVLPPHLRFQIVNEALDTDGSARALDQVASRHGLLLAELRALLEAGVHPVSPAPAEPARRPPSTRKCSKCDVIQPIDNFYTNSASKDGRQAHCIACNNQRPPTESRLVRNRARSRAYAALAKQFALEFAELYDAELEKARAEHTRLAAVAAGQGRHDAQVARLRPGPRRGTEQTIDRLDVARCLICHTHHDADHECPTCGDVTPDKAPDIKPWMVRAWALEHDMTVPTRGPIPAAVQAAYDAAHPTNEATVRAEA